MNTMRRVSWLTIKISQETRLMVSMIPYEAAIVTSSTKKAVVTLKLLAVRALKSNVTVWPA